MHTKNNKQNIDTSLLASIEKTRNVVDNASDTNDSREQILIMRQN